MNKFSFEKIINNLKEESLTKKEKSFIKKSIMEEVDPTLAFSWVERISVVFSRHALATSLVAVLVFAGTGISVAAEDALPGDALYVVKVEINEEIRDAVSIYPEHKARWNAEKARRRLVEARTLAERNELDEEKEEDLSERFASHTKDLHEALNELEETEDGASNALEVIAVAESTLKTYKAVIAVRNRQEASSSALGIDIENSRLRPDSHLNPEESTEDNELSDFEFLPDNVGSESALLKEVEDRLRSLNAEKEEVNKFVRGLSGDDAEEAVKEAEKDARKGAERALRMYQRVQGVVPEVIKAFIDTEISIESAHRQAAENLVSQGEYARAFSLYQRSINISARLAEVLRSDIVLDGDVISVVDVFESREAEESLTESILEDSHIEFKEFEESATSTDDLEGSGEEVQGTSTADVSTSSAPTSTNASSSFEENVDAESNDGKPLRGTTSREIDLINR